MVVKDWKVTTIEGALKNGPWFCLYLILTSCMGYGFVEFGRIAGASVKEFVEQSKKQTDTVLEEVKSNGRTLQATAADAIKTSIAAKEAASAADSSAKAAADATKDVAEKLLEAGELMDSVSQRRDDQAKKAAEQQDVQTKVLRELLEAVKGTAKNELTPPLMNNGGA